MLDNIALVLVVGFWSLAAILVFLRLAFPTAPITGKFIEYLGNVTVSHKDVVSRKDDTVNKPTSHHAAY